MVDKRTPSLIIIMWRFILSSKLRENRKRGKHLVVGSGTDMNGKLGSIPASVAVPEVRMLLFSSFVDHGGARRCWVGLSAVFYSFDYLSVM